MACKNYCLSWLRLNTRIDAIQVQVIRVILLSFHSNYMNILMLATVLYFKFGDQFDFSAFAYITEHSYVQLFKTGTLFHLQSSLIESHLVGNDSIMSWYWLCIIFELFAGRKITGASTHLALIASAYFGLHILSSIFCLNGDLQNQLFGSRITFLYF